MIILLFTPGTPTAKTVANGRVMWPVREFATETGWSAATGTATRTTFDTTTVTTQQLAERVKALIDDLLADKILGA